jgi:hypothetical protein
VSPLTPVYAEEYRDGFLLTPVHYDSTGIYTDTGFVLKTKQDYTAEQIKEMLSITGDNSLQVTMNDARDFYITLEKELEANSLYTFIITTPDNENISWTFQTRRDFAILGTLPANRSNYVPVNSGIEIYLSHTGFDDMDEYFEISPNVEGRFERNGYAAVFIPKELQPGTIYTVTIKKGLALKGTDQKLSNDYTFAFETVPEQEPGRIEQKGSIGFMDVVTEFTTNDAPVIPIHIYSGDREETEAIVKTTVYKFKSIHTFIDALKSKFEIPYWAYTSQNNLISTDEMESIASFEQTFNLTKWEERFLALPEPLPNGFYLVECTYNGLTAQVMLQSTDIAAYFTESDTETIVWVNNLQTRKASESADVFVSATGRTYKTNSNGIATFKTVKTNEDDEYKLDYIIVRKAANELVLVNTRYIIYRDDFYAADDYWRYFQTDRHLYKPDDVVQFWGFLKDRDTGSIPENVTVEIAEGGYWGIPEARFLSYFLPIIQKPLVSLNIPCDEGFFEGIMQLPKLSPGSYNITIKVDGQIVNSHYINVENYVKPAYKMTIEKDKNAIFLGETVNFTITPAFFEGTPLPSLDITYNMGGHPFEHKTNTEKSGPNGSLTVPFTATTSDDTAQGEQHVYINANASLPESGQIYSHEFVRVFVNDINANFNAVTDKNGKTTLTATLNYIDLSRINNPDNTDPYDYLGAPAAHIKIAGSIVYHYYEKIETGEQYDYINKVVHKVYRYEERTEKVKSFSIKTDSNGIAKEVFELEHPNEGWYTAELIWNDGNGRTMRHSVYLSNRYIPMSGVEYDWYHLEADKDKYRLNDDVTVTLKNNDEIVANPESVLYIEAQKGIIKHSVTNSVEYKTKFTENLVPNFYIKAVYFTGKNYIDTGTRNIRYDTDEVKLDIQLEADTASYRPGDTVTVKITAKDENQNPVAARVNLCLIDEAMLQISHYDIDVLGALYQWLNSGIAYSYSSHSAIAYYSRLAGAGAADTPSAAQAPSAMPKGLDGNGFAVNQSEIAYDMAEVQVRSEFRDTASFHVIALNDDGTGTFTFKLPDNVTSWYVTLAAISPDLYGGTGEAHLKVTLPFFINDSLNYTYLTDDFPFVGVSGYGNDLDEGEIITWQITSPQMPGSIRTATSKAFERINIPLQQLDEGVYELEIKAITEKGLSDGIKRTIYVTDSYHEIEEAVTEDLKVNMKLKGGKDGLTTLIFTDKSRGSLVPVLYNLMYSGGSRLDQKYTAYQAKLLLDKIAPVSKHYQDIGEVDLSQYQKPDGGYGILPYSESDVELSALLAQFLKDETGAGKLKQYFYSLILEEPGRVNAAALFGLAVMGEPVLVDLNNALKVQNLPLKDTLYLALAFESVGEAAIAQRIYDDKIVPLLENKDPYIRVIGTNDPDVILKDTALAAVLASRLDTGEKQGLIRYVTDNYSKKILMNAEKLLIVHEEYLKLSDSEVEFTYTYDGNTYTESLKDGGLVTVTVPSVRVSDVKITDVKGDASVVMVYKVPLTTQIQPDDTLKIKRTYYNYATGRQTTQFKQNDIVKVVLEWDIAPTAMDKYYEITDFAPSGLKPIENPYNAGIRPEKGIWWWFRNTDGQKVTFNVYRDTENKEPLVYYARVVSPGNFKADSTIMQGTLAKDSMTMGEQTRIVIGE